MGYMWFSKNLLEFKVITEPVVYVVSKSSPGGNGIEPAAIRMAYSVSQF